MTDSGEPHLSTTAQALAERIATAHRRIKERDQLQALLDQARRQLEQGERDLAARQQEAALEAADVEKLESFSGTRMWTLLTGRHEETLRREQLEAQVAEGKAAEAQVRCAALRGDVGEVVQHLSGYDDVEAELAAATQARETYLVESGSPEGLRLTEIAAQIGALAAEQRHLDEAIAAGERSLSDLDALEGQLGTASGWSTYDTFFGGGMISSAIKHDHMDEAAALSRGADQSLLAFGRELSDVGLTGVDGALSMSEGTRFLDVWFDNFFTDLSVRSRLETAKQRTVAARTRVRVLLRQLTLRRETVVQRARVLEQERQRLLG